MTAAVQALQDLATHPQVTSDSARVREACARLRWHEALRRRLPEAAAESRARGTWASAELDGARSSLVVVRDLMRGARDRPLEPDPAERVLHGAIAATAATEGVSGRILQAPRQVLAQLHLVAAAQLVPPDLLGRPRGSDLGVEEFQALGAAPDAERMRPRLEALEGIVSAGTALPAPLVVAVVHAEIAHIRPFTRGNGLVARAVERTLIHATGLDPTGVSVPEMGHRAGGVAAYHGALAAYGIGSLEGVLLWLRHSADALIAGVDEGLAVADAVLAGRLE